VVGFDEYSLDNLDLTRLLISTLEPLRHVLFSLRDRALSGSIISAKPIRSYDAWIFGDGRTTMQ
jgi:hypothetical protein